MRKLLCGLLFTVVALSAGELTGKWSGTFDITTAEGESKADTAYMDLKEQSGEVTGTAGPNAEKQWPLRKGKLDGPKLTFEVPIDDGGLLVFDLSFDGTTIQGTCAGTGNGGEKMSAKLSLKRLPAVAVFSRPLLRSPLSFSRPGTNAPPLQSSDHIEKHGFRGVEEAQESLPVHGELPIYGDKRNSSRGILNLNG